MPFYYHVIVLKKMTDSEIRNFLMKGTFTGKLATTRKNGLPHIAPIWFILEGDNTNIVFMTWHDSIKAKNIKSNPKVSLCVDDQTPPFSFVTVEGTAEIIDEPNDLLRWATSIAARYMGEKNAQTYGTRNSSEGELLLRIKPNKIIGQKDISE
jgi:PPOX class probable F420-dependent enzyme